MGADISREIVSLRSGTTVRKRRAARRLADLAFDRTQKDIIADEGGIGPLVELLKSRDRECRSNAVFAVAMLAEDVKNRSIIVAEDGLPALVRLLAYGGNREKACAARTIGMIVAEDKESKEVVRKEGGVQMLVRLLKSPNVMSTQQAAMALAHLTTTSPDTTLRSTLSSESGLSPLLRLLREGDDLSRMWATIIISHVADSSVNRSEIIKSDVIGCIIAQLKSNLDDCRFNGANALAALCEHDEDIQKSIVAENGVSALVSMLDDANDLCREQAALVLDILSKNKDTSHEVIVEDAVNPVLCLLDSECEYCRVSASCILANLSCIAEGCDAIEEHDGIEKLLGLLDTTDERTRWNAICTLGNLGQSHPDRQLAIVRLVAFPLSKRAMVCGICGQLYSLLFNSSKTASPDIEEVLNTPSHVNSSGTTTPHARPGTARSTTPLRGQFERKATESKKYISEVSLREVYRLGGVLGTGGFATVRQATHRKSGGVFACKIMSLPALGMAVPETENSREDIFKEIEILSRLDHENIVGLKEFYFDDHYVYLVSELLKGGELLDAVLDNSDGYSEDVARKCFVQLMLGVRYLHSQNVAHRDLKLENLLLVTKGDISNIKITDFGLAKLTKGTQLSTIVGTPQYVAPEIIRGVPGLTYSVAVDMWSAGVILFILLGGYPPFYSKSDAQLFEQIRHGRWSFDDPVWRSVSRTAKNLVAQLLVVDPEKRLSSERVFEHPWIKDKMAPATPLPLTHEKMRNTFDKWKRAYTLVTAVNKFKAAGIVAEQHPEKSTVEEETTES